MDSALESVRAGRATPPASKRTRSALVAVALAGLSTLAAACGGTSSGATGEAGTVDLVAYSTPQELYEQDLEPAFNETPEGEGVGFSNSFGSSGDQSRAVESGLPADIVHLSLEPDMQRLVDAGIVAEDWNQGRYEGIVQNSVVVFVTRPGNPKDITEWDDLVRDDVEVITPNPFTSGGARWNIMAAYGSQTTNGASDEEGLQFVADVLGNTSVQDASARDALQTFVGGKGDVLLAYENEALQAQEAGEEVEYTVPDDTLLIETPFAVSEEADDPEAAQAFSDYLYSEEGQTGFAEGGYRPVDQQVLKQFSDEFPEPQNLFTIDEFGGWETVSTEFFDPASGSVAEIERDLGVATE